MSERAGTEHRAGPDHDVRSNAGPRDSLLSFGFPGMASRRLADTPTPARRRHAQPISRCRPDDSGRTVARPPAALLARASSSSLPRSESSSRSSGWSAMWPSFRVLSTACNFIGSRSRSCSSSPFFLRAGLWRSTTSAHPVASSSASRALTEHARFSSLGTSFMAGTVAAHLFRNELRRREPQRAVAGEGRGRRDRAVTVRTTVETVDRVQRNGGLAQPHRGSMAFVPAAADSPEAVSRGPWEHLSGLPKAD